MIMRKIALLFVMVFIACYAGQAQGIKFEEGTLQDMLAKAKAEDKLIFIDVYTQWCGPCKQVAAEVFPNKLLGTYYNENFINYKLDAESPEGKEFVKKHPIDGVPSFFYINGEGQVIHKLLGAKDVLGFLQEAEMVDMYKKYGGIEVMEKAVKNGTATKELLYDYYQAANAETKPLALNLYLKSLSTEELMNVNNRLVSHISLYDKDLMFRLADEIVKFSHTDKFSDKKFANSFSFSIAFPVQYMIGFFLDQSIKQGNRQWFNELLELKERFNGYNGWLLDGDWIVRNERGLFFATPEYIKLCYMNQNRVDKEEFKVMVVDYMSKLMDEKPIDSLWRKDERPTLEVLKEDGIKGQEVTARYFFQKGDMTAHNILKWTNYFWKESPSDKKIKRLCSEWVNYAYYMNPYNSSVAVLAANWLARIGYEKDAIKILETAIQVQKDMKNDNPQLYRTLETNLRDVKNGKV